MNLEEPKESKYDYAFIQKVGGLLQTLYEDYPYDDVQFDYPPFEGETFKSVYQKTKELVGDCPFGDETFEEVYLKTKELVGDERPNSDYWVKEKYPIEAKEPVEGKQLDYTFWTEAKVLYMASDLIHWNYLVKVKKLKVSQLFATGDILEKLTLKWAILNDYYKSHYPNSGYHETDEFSKLVNMFGLEDKSWIRELTCFSMKTHNISLDDLKDCPNLTRLTIYSGSYFWDYEEPYEECERKDTITDVSFLSGLTKLKYLKLCGHCKIADYSPLSNLVNLTTLEVSHGLFNDLSPLSNLANLTHLDLNTNSIINLSPISGLVNLTTLNLNENRIVDLSPISGLVNLTTLNLTSTRNVVIDLSPLSELAQLTHLDLSGNQITDISPLSELAQLTHLVMGWCQVTDLSPLSELIKLTYLDLNRNQITDITPVLGLVNLAHLDVSGNPLQNVPSLIGLTKLVKLQLPFGMQN